MLSTHIHKQSSLDFNKNIHVHCCNPNCSQPRLKQGKEEMAQEKIKEKKRLKTLE
jgi:hypothetical protein